MPSLLVVVSDVHVIPRYILKQNCANPTYTNIYTTIAQ